MGVLNKGQWQGDDVQLEQVDQIAQPLIAEKDRYHFYFAYGCPFAHRANLVRHYLGLTDVILASSTAPIMTADGLAFNTDFYDTANHLPFLRDVYLKGKANFSGRASVPLLWDKQTQSIASHNSGEMAWEIAEKFAKLGNNPADLIPSHLRNEIAKLNDWLDVKINRKVYQVGYADTPEKYQKQLQELFQSLSKLDQRLAEQRYLFGEQITLSDFWLFPTLIRFEAVYADLFRTNLKPLAEFQHLYRYMLALYADPRIRATVDIDFTMQFYYVNSGGLSPDNVPKPVLPWLNTNLSN
ncbi:glutathione S-transferase C-terminal domain-containing protein [Moraxella sp. ZJ142]|uniref:glutathione S-transferase C-terminal domain-containing protein n=1 Tax=Moraxella marmotae TaxID=3344520 RepID=UPI0035D49C92